MVVLETGMGPTMDTWRSIFDEVSASTRVFAYNRPGYGRSSARQAPQSAQDIAERLHRTLRQTGHPPPYVLVGHSAGGLYAAVFARTYPDEVAGVVLIDSSHPSQFDYLKAEKPVLHGMLITSASVGRRRYESKILRGLSREAENWGPFPDVPLVVLTAEKSSLFETRAMRKQWLVFQREFAAMSAQSTHIFVDGSHHFIYKDKPEVVIRAIKNVVDQAHR